ncbi:MAG TPA: hypothetical protein VMT28_01625 [Terriglobales bacterium]|jgi:two-component system OmpR family sensor kinase|nr:hypothetical protein [Terriglobales bacterium]
MNSRTLEREVAASRERRELLSELFHALNQPLTTLRCALELGLQQPHREQSCSHTMEAALLQAESVARLTAGIRELLEADDPGDDLQAVPLDRVLREALLDWSPAADAAEITLLARDLLPCRVRFEPQRLRQALFRLLEYVLHVAPAGATVKFDLRTHERAALLSIATAPKDVSRVRDAVSADPVEAHGERVQRRLALAIARSALQAAGGSLVVNNSEEQCALEIRLVLAEVPVQAKPCSCQQGCAGQE